MVRTAAALVIGNEILTGKVEDENIAYLAKELFDLGIALRCIVICPDDMGAITSHLETLRAAHDLVFTSGGVGPTHDDITIDAVAATLRLPIVRSAEVERMIHAEWGDRVTEEHLRMANIPEGAELVRNAEVPWPTLVIENIFVLPGVPEIFRRKFTVLRERLRGATPFVSHAVYTRCDEGEIATLLSRLVQDHPAVTIGSYPRWHDPRYSLKVTFDGTSTAAVKAAADGLVAALPPDTIVRREGLDLPPAQ